MRAEELQDSLGSAYTVERELGGGGMSQVFLATENRFNRRVVVKVLSRELAAGVTAERFEQEIQLAARLQQANIVPLLATGDANGIPYFTMPFVEGESLRARLNARKSFEISECASIMRDVARALSYAHAAGVVHRDIKPDNVLLSHGAAMVTDFGIAKAVSDARTIRHGALTQAGTSLGSPGYMSPEQVAGDPNIDHRSDIYALGCLIYELLAGRPPFTGETPQRVLAAHISEKPKSPSAYRSGIPADLASLVMRCLEKDPANRPANADVVLHSLGTDSHATSNGTSRTRKRWLVFAVTSALLVGGALFAKFNRTTGNAPSNTSLAVLPLANLSGDKSNDFFGEGLAEEITATLARTGVHVVGRSSARALTAKGVTPAEIAERFGVGSVLQGSVQRAGDRVRISISLVSMPDEAILWSERYDRDMKDVFAVQDEIANAVAAQLKVQLGGGAGRTARTATVDPEAHTAYLQGLYLWNRRTVSGLRKAIALFGDAVRRDPQYAQAYAGMALSYVVLPAYDDIGADDVLARSVDAANKALAIDSTNVPAITALAYATALQYRNAESERLFVRAIALDSSFATAHFWYALLLLQQERNEEALREILRARSLEPASLVINTGVTQVLYDMRRYDEAEKAGKVVMELDSAFQLGIIDLAKVHIEQGKVAEAIRAIEPTLDVPGISRREKAGVLGYALARAGRTDEAKRILLPAAQSDPNKSQRGMVAAALDAAGEREKAIEILREAIDDHDLWLAHYFPAAPYDGLRTDSRVRALFAKVSAR